jgi:uncharacterized membrane protein YcaP (DUF421 family)
MYTVIHAIFGYLFLTLTVRVLTRRPGAQMTAFEFVLVFLIGGVIILSTVGDDPSMTNCFGAVLAIVLMHRLVTYFKVKSKRFSELVDGRPVVLLKNGEWQSDLMKHMRLQDTDVMASARTKGIPTLKDIKYAILERNGAISILKDKK